MFLQVTFEADHPASSVAQAMLRRWVDEHMGYYHQHPTQTPVGMAGYMPLPGGGRWLTAGCNYAAYQRVVGVGTLTINSRRHGLPMGVREVLRILWPEGPLCYPHDLSRGGVMVLAYDTQKFDWVPWAVREEVEAVTNPKAIKASHHLGPLTAWWPVGDQGAVAKRTADHVLFGFRFTAAPEVVYEGHDYVAAFAAARGETVV